VGRKPNHIESKQIQYAGNEISACYALQACYMHFGHCAVNIQHAIYQLPLADKTPDEDNIRSR